MLPLEAHPNSSVSVPASKGTVDQWGVLTRMPRCCSGEFEAQRWEGGNLVVVILHFHHKELAQDSHGTNIL